MSEPVKRGRGRPPGAKNIKTLVKEEAKRDDKAALTEWLLKPLRDDVKPPKTTQEFEERAYHYFEQCVNHERPPTKPGLALQLGYAGKDSMHTTLGVPSHPNAGVYKRALDLIEELYQFLAVSKNSVGAIFLLKSVFGHSDRVDITSQGGSMAPVNLTFMPPSLAPLNNPASIIDNETRTLTLPVVEGTVIAEDADDTGDDNPC